MGIAIFISCIISCSFVLVSSLMVVRGHGNIISIYHYYSLVFYLDLQESINLPYAIYFFDLV